jgi:hypothetical protein
MQHGPIVTPLTGPLDTKTWPPLDDAGRVKLRRLALLHRLFGGAFVYVFVAVFGGLIGGVWTGDTLFAWLMGSGMAVTFLVLLSAYFVIPFLRCPRCKHRYFFRASGWKVILETIDVTQKACLHCQLPLKAEPST